NDAAEVHFERDPMGRIVRELTRLPDGTEHWVASRYGPDGYRIRVQSSDGHLHHIERNLDGDVLAVELEGARWRVDLERGPWASSSPAATRTASPADGTATSSAGRCGAPSPSAAKTTRWFAGSLDIRRCMRASARRCMARSSGSASSDAMRS